MQKKSAIAPRVAIIGAGMAGLSAARTLQDNGYAVHVFDKARGLGGRTATRRSADYAFDHGAQYFTVKDARFRRAVASWCEAGVVQPWQGRIATVAQGSITLKANQTERYVGVPGMNAMARHLGKDLTVHLQTRITVLDRAENGWRGLDEAGRHWGTYDAVLITAPPAQAQSLLAASPTLAQRMRSVNLLPCWAVMAVFQAPLAVPFDGAFVEDGPLSWIARNTSKPLRPCHEAWVLHASSAWSTTHLDEEASTVAEMLLEAFFHATGHAPSSAVFLQAHRWRYALPENPLAEECLWDGEQALGVCGDWCHGSRIEGAFLSGLAGAERIFDWAK